jgi:hypothetical protein
MPAAESLTEFHNEKQFRPDQKSPVIVLLEPREFWVPEFTSHRHPYRCMLLRQCTLLRPFSDDGHGETIGKRSVRSSGPL